MLGRLTGGGRRPSEFTERPSTSISPKPGEPKEGILESDSDEEGGTMTRSDFMNGTSEDRARTASSYKSAMSNGGGRMLGGIHNGEDDDPPDFSSSLASGLQQTLGSMFSRSYSDGGSNGKFSDDEGDSDEEDDDEKGESGRVASDERRAEEAKYYGRAALKVLFVKSPLQFRLYFLRRE